MLGPQFMPGGGGSSTPEPPEMLFIKRNGNTAPTLEVGDFVKAYSLEVPLRPEFFGSPEIVIEGFYLGGEINDYNSYRITDIIAVGGVSDA